MRAPRSLLLRLGFLALSASVACSEPRRSADEGAASPIDAPRAGAPGSAVDDPIVPEDPSDAWLRASTVSLRNRVQVPGSAARLNAAALIAQLTQYDPDRLLRCEMQDDPSYRAAIDALGGVSWGHAIQFLEDTSQPEFRLGPPPPPRIQDMYPSSIGGAANAPAPAVVIEEADVVALSESLALFHSASHGLMLVDLSGAEPRFVCAAKLPGQVQNFFYYREHLVAMVGSTLLHFRLAQTRLQFIEALPLRGPILDTRRFNDKLVVYMRLDLAPPSAPSAPIAPIGPVGPVAAPVPAAPRPQHRALQVFRFGDKLVEELSESLINTTVDATYLRSGAVSDDTAPGTVLHRASSFGDVLWASDRYFVVTEFLDVTKLDSWQTRTWQVCSRSHTVETPYRHCFTRYETRPNPSYVPPDNSSGDRACKGVTLADCLRKVASASNPTIEVPIETKCEERVEQRWVCDAYESRSQRYPEFGVESATRLSIYEYRPEGFVRLDGKVRSIVMRSELDGVPIDIRVDKLTTSSEAYDLSIPGRLQTLYFQRGFMYAVASGELQVYAMGDGSLVRSSTLRVANATLQSSLFAADKLYLSDFGYARNGMDHSTLRVIDLSNGAFPRQVSQDYQLPGGHASILPTRQGILTIGAVANFENVTRNAVKLGLFVDPFATEKAYLILATELSSVFLSETKAHSFDAVAERLFLPYTGIARDGGKSQARLGISHLADDAIVSDGALGLREPVQRVRARPGSTDQQLGFGPNTISWIERGEGSWKARPVLEHYTPIALYRRSDADDYLELSRLGEQCKLSLGRLGDLAAHGKPVQSEPFECGAAVPLAFADNLLFGTSHGVHFDEDGTITPLTPARVAELVAKAQQRGVCLFSATPTAASLDYAKLPPADGLRCYSRAEYQALVAETSRAGAAGAPGSR
jgi:hypothetical protein